LTKRFDQVVEKIRRLPDWEQDEIAVRLEADLRGMEDWLAQSGEKDSEVERMAREALRDHREGRSEPFPTPGDRSSK